MGLLDDLPDINPTDRRGKLGRGKPRPEKIGTMPLIIEPPRLRCPICASLEIKITGTRKTPSGVVFQRYRLCLACGQPFVTIPAPGDE